MQLSANGFHLQHQPVQLYGLRAVAQLPRSAIFRVFHFFKTSQPFNSLSNTIFHNYSNIMKLCELHWVTWVAWIVWVLLSSVSCNYWCVPQASMQWVLMKKTPTHKLLIFGGVKCIDKDIKHVGEHVLIQGEVKCIDKDIKHLWEKVVIPGEVKLKTFPPFWQEAGIGVGARCNWCNSPPQMYL